MGAGLFSCHGRCGTTGSEGAMFPICCSGQGEAEFDEEVEVVAYKQSKPAAEVLVGGKQYQQNLGSHIRLPSTVGSLSLATTENLKPVAGRPGTGFIQPMNPASVGGY